MTQKESTEIILKNKKLLDRKVIYKEEEFAIKQFAQTMDQDKNEYNIFVLIGRNRKGSKAVRLEYDVFLKSVKLI